MRFDEQLALPVHGTFAELPPDLPVAQRWRHRRHSFLRTSEGGFDARRYRVVPLSQPVAKAYVEAHHYSHSFPADRFRFGMFIDDAGPRPAGGVTTGRVQIPADLVGVAVFGNPMNNLVLRNPLPDLEPLVESLECNRVVLEGPVLASAHRVLADQGRAPANSETWMLAQCNRLLAEAGVKGIVAFSDPVPRQVKGQVVFAGHYGAIYGAGNAIACGRSTERIITLLPDGTVITDLTLDKIRNQRRGHEYSEKKLIALGASPRIGGRANAAAWLRQALEDVGARRRKHPGCYRYVWATSREHRRNLRLGIPATARPKPDLAA